jgi:hypothetical protein
VFGERQGALGTEAKEWFAIYIHGRLEVLAHEHVAADVARSDPRGDAKRELGASRKLSSVEGALSHLEGAPVLPELHECLRDEIVEAYVVGRRCRALEIPERFCVAVLAEERFPRSDPQTSPECCGGPGAKGPGDRPECELAFASP